MVIMLKPILSRLPSLIVISLFVALIVYLLWSNSTEQVKKYQQITSVQTAPVSLAEFKDVIEAIGTTIANEQLQITTKYSDVVEKIYFRGGQKVKKGDTLLQLDRQEEIAKVKELEANREEAVLQLTRLQDLLAKKATSKSLVDQQEAKTKAVDAQLTIARIKRDDTTIKAPFNGTLGFRNISEGALLAPGDVITSLDDLSRVKVDFAVPERFLTIIELGQNINSSNDAYVGELFQGKITSIAPRIDPVTRTLRVRASIDNSDYRLRPGMLLKVKILSKVESVLQIPESAILPIEDKHFVFVIEGNLANRKEIKLGRRQPGIVEVISGLDKSERVVIEGTLKLRDGNQVEVLEN